MQRAFDGTLESAFSILGLPALTSSSVFDIGVTMDPLWFAFVGDFSILLLCHASYA